MRGHSIQKIGKYRDWEILGAETGQHLLPETGKPKIQETGKP